MAVRFLMQHNGSVAVSDFRRVYPACQASASTKVKESDVIRRRMALKRVDRELSKGNYKAALSLVKQLQGKPGGLRGFGAAKQVPQGITSFTELKLNGIDLPFLESILDSVLDSIKNSIDFSFSKEFSLLGLENLKPGESYGSPSPCEDHLKCMQHEAGHFLVGYLLGFLPKRYRVPRIEDLSLDRFSRAAVQFCGFEFLKEVTEVDDTIVSKKNIIKGKQRGKDLISFICVMLGGLTAEHLVFGYSEGLHGDVDKLDRVLRWLNFTENEANSQIRWAAVNTVSILHRHSEARSKLAEAMGLGRSVGFCIDTIENAFSNKEI